MHSVIGEMLQLEDKQGFSAGKALKESRSLFPHSHSQDPQELSDKSYYAALPVSAAIAEKLLKQLHSPLPANRHSSVILTLLETSGL